MLELFEKPGFLSCDRMVMVVYYFFISLLGKSQKLIRDEKNKH